MKYVVELAIQYVNDYGYTIIETKTSEHIASGDKIVVSEAGGEGLAWARTKNGKLKKVKVYKEIYCEEE